MRRTTSFVNKNSQILELRPLLVGTLVGRENIRQQLRSAQTSGIDLLEVRLDTFTLPSRTTEAIGYAKDVLSQINRTTHLPILLTLRSFKEMGSSAPVK